MYYIVNHTEHIIAADKNLLNLLTLETIDELYTKIALGDIQFTRSEGTVTISTKNEEKTYLTQEHMLSGMLGDITLVQIDPSDEKPVFVLDDEYFDLLSDVGESKSTKIPEITPEEQSKDNVTTINLDNIQPLFFHFQMEASADDLSLPVALLQEFVHDFIKQTHIETEKMLEAYEKGDLDTVQNIAQLLKEAATNLHISALSDPLYKIQFCEDSIHLEDLIKEYWGIFLSFENQVNLQSKK